MKLLRTKGMQGSIHAMAAKAKIAISLAREVLKLVDRHARGRSRSQCIEQELLRALRAREWERLSAQLDVEDEEEQVAWAESAFAAAHDTLARDEGGSQQRRARRSSDR
jgi:hypothetical protein